jgi:hypothetical protein
VFDLLHPLVENAGQLVSADRLVEVVGKGRIVSRSAISACIAAPRRAAPAGMTGGRRPSSAPAPVAGGRSTPM